MKPFAKTRVVYDHTCYGITPCPCPICRFSDRLGGGRSHFGMCESKVKRLNFSREEPLADTEQRIRAHYQMVADELAQPFTMLFGSKGGDSA